jgi:hypothetical protein
MVDPIVFNRDEPEKSAVVWRDDAELGYLSENSTAPAYSHTCEAWEIVLEVEGRDAT